MTRLYCNTILIMFAVAFSRVPNLTNIELAFVGASTLLSMIYVNGLISHKQALMQKVASKRRNKKK